MPTTKQNEPIPVIDIFAGAGGLGEGFAAYPDRDNPAFRIALSIEKEPAAARTLRLRAFFRAFAPDRVPEDYYALLRGGRIATRMQEYLDGRLWLADLLQDYDGHRGAVPEDAWNLELGSRHHDHAELDRRVARALGGRENWVLVGGPPCQPFSTVGRSKQQSLDGYELATDHRHVLYREYLGIIARHWPAVFVMENVKGILSAKVNGEKEVIGKS